jgi:transposase
MRPEGSAEALEARRRVAARMFALGQTNVAVAAACGASLSAVKAWKRAWREGGEAALAARPHPGPEPRLSLDGLERLERVLLAGALKAGFDSDLWTCPRVAEVIQRQFGVVYHPDHVSRILHKLGWSCQKPERRARERDEAKIEEWRKREWPRIKKGGRAESYHRLRR